MKSSKGIFLCHDCGNKFKANPYEKSIKCPKCGCIYVLRMDK